MERLLETLVRKFVAPFFEVDASGALPVHVRGGHVVIEHAFLKCDAIERALYRASDTGLPLPVSLALGHISHASLSIPWALSGPIELDIDGVDILVRHAHDAPAEKLREMKEEHVRANLRSRTEHGAAGARLGGNTAPPERCSHRMRSPRRCMSSWRACYE